MLEPHLKQTPNWSLEGDVAVCFHCGAVQLIASRDDILPLEELQLGLQQGQDALVSALMVVHC